MHIERHRRREGKGGCLPSALHCNSTAIISGTKHLADAKPGVTPKNNSLQHI